jgi:quinol monooxygenase YgiN
MFVRNVTFRLKPNMAADYNRAFQNEVLPLLRKEKGFKNGIALSNPDSPDAVAISLWENKVDAETYNTKVYPTVLKILEGMIEGKPNLKTFEIVTSTLDKIAVAA